MKASASPSTYRSAFVALQKRLLYFLLLVIYPINVFTQDFQPTDKLSLINLYIVNQDEEPLQQQIELVARSTGKSYAATSNMNGIASILVPRGDKYVLNMNQEPNYDAFDIPDKPGYTLNYKIYYRTDTRIAPGFARVLLSVVTTGEDPLAGELIAVRSTNDSTKYSGQTDKAGQLILDLPSNAEYIVDFKRAPDYDLFEIPPNTEEILKIRITFDGSHSGNLFPSMHETLVEFTYMDPEKKPIAGDTLYIQEYNGPFSYMGVTDSDGKISTLVPNGKTYYFSTPVHKNFEKLYNPDGIERHTFRVTFNGISSKAYYTRIKQRKELLRKRDSAYQAKVKQMEYLMGLSQEERKIYYRENILNEAAIAKKSIITNPQYFIERNYNVAAALYRNLDQWKNQLIVTDVTCSMFPYLEQVLMWHAMRLTIDKHNEYIFFNDGDGKPQEEKIAGKTGGIHYTDEVSFDSVLQTSWYAQSFGCSGDGPENDFEALLAAVQLNDPGREIILIADNFSDVRDYELLKEINVPIRVILCGVQGSVNEQYLDLAYHTKGSVHSIEDDLFLMSPIAEGKSIFFRGKEYVLTNGRFFYVGK